MFAESKNKFNANASTTFKPFESNPKFTIDYIGGELIGNRAYDTVSVIEITVLPLVRILYSIFFRRLAI